jgi:CDP-4-dehydro-6-deoxyglucose reductase
MFNRAKVKILPSGHRFISEGNSNLLEAGLRSGLALGYGCSNGNCGECLAKIVSGEVKKIQHHDFRISDEKQLSGHILMCCNGAITDLVLEAPEAINSNEIPEQNLTARVKSLNFVNDDIALIHLKTPRTSRLRFLAGQYVNLGGGNIPAACHSIGSCPCDDMNLHFQIPRISGDRFSDHVFNQLKKGDNVDIKGPFGNFVLKENSARPLVFVAWNTGFSPIRSLIEHAMALDVTETIKLIWITESKNDRYLDNLCRSWNDALDNFDYVPVDSGPGKVSIDAGSIFKRLSIEPADLNGHDFYIAADKSLMHSCDDFLLQSGLPSTQIRLDKKDHD